MIGKTIGQYQVIDKIGEGGMGAVYKAEDTTLHRLVALKTLSTHLTEDEEAQERFVREAQSASSLNHPNITTVFEFIEDDDTRLICMEYVEGKTIRDMVESGVVSVRKAIDIIMQAAEALEAAHNKGILHRDVKSANIMVNMEGRVKVMDFGLAHLEEKSQLTRTGTTMGTLSYSSPEHISGKPVDRRSEIFSLGVVFYELLTGQLPFKAANEAEILFAIINNEPPKLTNVREDIPELVEAVVERMLEKDVELRYQACGEVISDLKGIRKEMETSTVGITGALGRLQTRSRRRTIITASIGTVVVAGLVALYLLVLAPKPTGPPRLAVLPFEEIGPTEEEWFADAIANEVRSRLSVLRGLEVVTYLGADQYQTENKTPRQIGNELGVDYLLRASIQWEQFPNEQTQIRLFPELIRANDGKRLPVETCEGTLTGAGITQLQRTLSELVTRELGVVLLEPEQQYIQQNPTEDIVAFNLYSLGRYHWNRRNLEQAIDYFQKAIERDPDYAQAYAGLN